MKRVTTLILLVIIGACGYYIYENRDKYQTAFFSACRVPLEYRIGVIDEGFDVTVPEAKRAVAEAEAMWEELTGKELFVYSDEADFTVNFVFDTRQQLTNEEHAFREVLDEKEGFSDTLKTQYDTLVTEYEETKASYEARLSVYERDLAAYNAEVEKWNNEGGAPEAVFERLNDQEEELSNESQALGAAARELNNLVAQINRLGEEGNRAVEEYNADVAQYNDRFNHEFEFTQGDYQGDQINIYQFDNDTELRTVLAHELGHALSLDHVNDSDSVMYYLMDIDTHQGELTMSDLNEFKRVCE